MLGIPAREAASRQLGLTDVHGLKLVFQLDVRAARALAVAFWNVFGHISAPFVSPSFKFAMMRTLLVAKRSVVRTPAAGHKTTNMRYIY